MSRYGFHVSWALFTDPECWIYLRVHRWYVQLGPRYLNHGPFPSRP